MNTSATAPVLGIRPQFTMGDRLRKARTFAMPHVDVAEFAEIIGTSKNTVTNYELQNTSPERMKNIVLREWARVTGVDEEWLRYGDEGKPSDYKAPVSRPSTRPRNRAGSTRPHGRSK